MSRFFVTVLWEFLQNLPVIVFFAAAVWLWSQGERGKAIACVVCGAVIGSLVIRFTEVMADGGREPLAVTVLNIVVLSLLQALFTAYLGSEKKWSSWRTDLILGGIAGLSLAIGQGLAALGAPVIGIALHSVALAMAGVLVLVGIRVLKGRTLVQAVLYSVPITVAMTVVISIVDYGYLLFI
jgi:hypothetical protein